MNETEKRALFNQGEVVLYQNGDKFELGIIKRVIPVEVTKKRRLRQDGLDGPATGETYIDTEYEYFVNYHTGDTAARTNERNLHKLVNAYAFDIRRHLARDTKTFTKICDIIEKAGTAIYTGEAFDHGFPEARLVPSDWNELCFKSMLDQVVQDITPLLEKYLEECANEY